ncbi:MAG TPA: HD domain-containing protein [Planctomycetota bacterium]|nr:HD domain-containing protein [Planctomycetota bacterium]
MHSTIPSPAKVEAERQVAVVDCGTSSVRAFIAQLPTDAGDPQILEDLSFPVDLTDAFVSGKLSRQAMDGVVEAFVNIAATARGYGITSLRAVGTSALREATNSDVLVERLRANQGVDLEIIDNAEEARLYSEALRLVLTRVKRELPGRTLMIDLGGGSTCIGLITNGKLVHSVDEHYGSVRILEQFHSLRDSNEFALTIDRYALGAARMMLDRLPKGQINHLVITSGDVRKLCSLLTAAKGKGGIQPLLVKDVVAWYQKMQEMTPVERAGACASDARGAALLLPTASLLRHLSAETGATEVLVPYLTLRDGLIADLMPGAHGAHYLSAADLMAEGMQLVSRYGGNLGYAENTASLATQIFDQTAALHALGERERALLEFSALVHDIGSYINVRNRHKHSMYVIQSSDIAGLTAIKKEMVANIARYHRKSSPETHHLEFQSLPRAKRVVVSYLAAILRLAYGLDVERTQRIKKVRCEVSDGRLLIHVDRRQIALERWSLSGKAGMFAEVFGLDVAVVAREET